MYGFDCIYYCKIMFVGWFEVKDGFELIQESGFGSFLDFYCLVVLYVVVFVYWVGVCFGFVNVVFEQQQVDDFVYVINVIFMLCQIYGLVYDDFFFVFQYFGCGFDCCLGNV